jgi:tRNA_anti-like
MRTLTRKWNPFVNSRQFKLFVGSVLTVALLSGFGCGDAKQSDKDRGWPPRERPPIDNKTSDPPKVELDKAKADFALDADAWNAEWEKDREAATKKYKGKIIELSGAVRSVDDDPYGSVGYIYLKTQKGILGVRCALNDRAPWLKVGPDCTIKVRGQTPDFGLSGDLYPCVIVESSPNTSLDVTAAQLAKAFAKEKEDAVKKYHEKWLIVEGELIGKEPSKIDEGRFIYLILKGDGDVNVRCYVANNNDDLKKANDNLKVGQKMKVCGEARIDAQEKGPEISCKGRKVTLIP